MSETHLSDGDELEIAHEADFGITRNEDGELTPVKQQIPGTGKAIRCRPLSSGDLEEYQDVLEGDNADDARVAELLCHHVVEGIGSDATEEKVREHYPGYVVSGLVQALKNSSGYDVFLAVQRQRNEEVKQNAELMNMFDIEDMTELARGLGNGQRQKSASTEN